MWGEFAQVCHKDSWFSLTKHFLLRKMKRKGGMVSGKAAVNFVPTWPKTSLLSSNNQAEFSAVFLLISWCCVLTGGKWFRLMLSERLFPSPSEGPVHWTARWEYGVCRTSRGCHHCTFQLQASHQIQGVCCECKCCSWYSELNPGKRIWDKSLVILLFVVSGNEKSLWCSNTYLGSKRCLSTSEN